MASDAAVVLDVANVQSAHVFGVSMGALSDRVPQTDDRRS